MPQIQSTTKSDLRGKSSTNISNSNTLMCQLILWASVGFSFTFVRGIELCKTEKPVFSHVETLSVMLEDSLTIEYNERALREPRRECRKGRQYLAITLPSPLSARMNITISFLNQFYSLSERKVEIMYVFYIH